MKNDDTNYILNIVTESFKKIAPFWPLKNLIAVNPLQGLENLPIEEAFKKAAAYFQQQGMPKEIEAINLATIKWLQVFFDEGQATIAMPLRKQGFYRALQQLILYDVNLHHNDEQQKKWIKDLPKNAEDAIAECLARLSISKESYEQFLILMLTTLPGWASYIKYRTDWAGKDNVHSSPVTQVDYLAVRLIITCLLWPEAKNLLNFYANAYAKDDQKSLCILKTIEKVEKTYRLELLKKLAMQPINKAHQPEAQFVFCIDVRSEPFRRAFESIGNYETFGFAGFFGIPVLITDVVTKESYASCPVLLLPKHEVKESPCLYEDLKSDRKGHERLVAFKKIYQSVKYTFITPFALVECLGIISGIWMGLLNFMPGIASKLKSSMIKTIRKPQEVEPSLENISFSEQCRYAQSALKMMGLTNHFAPVVVFCGHGSMTQNNAFATALDCGACGGRHGESNARILAAILNNKDVRAQLFDNNIIIPEATRFIAAKHNTTTDEVVLYGSQDFIGMQKLKQDLEKAREINSLKRLEQIEKKAKVSDGSYYTWLRSQDWAQVRPEWGLARNAAFIVGPRDITSALNLEGRCFLHSYDYMEDDTNGSLLTVILTAPMVVAEWINMQYLFSTLDNVAFGAGSKVTKNIVGKIGIMQGNASDLMTGLPLQSVCRSDKEAYHEPQRLMTVVFAPRLILEKIVHEQEVLQKLFGNGWVQLACIEPDSRKVYLLNRDFTWQNIH